MYIEGGRLMKLLILSILCITISLVSCGRRGKETAISEKAYIGVIETTGQKNHSIITFYNRKLMKEMSLELPFGSMGSYFDLPKVRDNKLYVVPKGIASLKDKTVILQVDLDNGAYRTYDLKQPEINSFCMDEHYVYGVNTLNQQSIISRYDLEEDDLDTLVLGKIFVGNIERYGDKLYAYGFGESLVGMSSYLYIIDPQTLTIEKQIDISRSGQDQLGTELIDNTLFFTNSLKYHKDYGEIPSNGLSKLDTIQHQVTDIQLPYEYPFQIIQHEGLLYVSHYNLVQGEGDSLSIYNDATGDITTFSFGHKVAQIAIEEGQLYVLDGEKIHVYDIGDNEIVKKNETEIVSMLDKDVYYYVSGFFIKE